MSELFDKALQKMADEIARRGVEAEAKAFEGLSNGMAQEPNTRLRDLADRQQRMIEQVYAERESLRRDAMRLMGSPQVFVRPMPEDEGERERVRRLLLASLAAPQKIQKFKIRYDYGFDVADVPSPPPPPPPVDPLDRMVDGVTVRELMGHYMVRLEYRPMKSLTPAQREALSIEWSRQLREKQAAARVRERHQVVVQGEDD